MTRIVCAEDCGNSPRKLLLKKLLTALAKGEAAFILKNLSDEVVWTKAGAAPLQGREAVAAALDERKREPVALMLIDNIVTHGPTAAANGTMKLAGGATYAFSHVYRFNGATDPRIKEVTEFLVPA